MWHLRTGGVRGLARALLGRLVHRHWRVRLFQDDPNSERAPAVWPDGFRFELHHARTPIDAALRTAIENAGAAGLIGDLAESDRYYLVWDRDEVASYGAVFMASPQRSVLGLPREAVLIGGCATLERYRGRSLYKLALSDTAAALRHAGVHQIFVEVRPENESSIRGVLGARFADRGLVDARIWFGALVWRDGALHRLRRSGT